VRVTCPKCSCTVGVRARTGEAAATTGVRPRRRAFVGDEARPFREFLVRELEAFGFEVEVFEDGAELLEKARVEKPQILVLNVYMRGKLGVEVCEAVKQEPSLSAAKVVFIGALFRANRYRSNPTNLYGADEYIEEIISSEELRAMLAEFFPSNGDAQHALETPLEKELDEARRLARIIVSDLILYHPDQVAEGIRLGSLDAVLGSEIIEARGYYDSRISERVRNISGFFDETLRDYVERRVREAGR
jgi:CheY-like chemotaxis protein